MLVAGTGQNGFGLNWGNGFITDRDLINNRGLSDATPFFTELMAKPYLNKVMSQLASWLVGLPGLVLYCWLVGVWVCWIAGKLWVL